MRTKRFLACWSVGHTTAGTGCGARPELVYEDDRSASPASASRLDRPRMTRATGWMVPDFNRPALSCTGHGL